MRLETLNGIHSNAAGLQRWLTKRAEQQPGDHVEFGASSHRADPLKRCRAMNIRFRFHGGKRAVPYTPSTRRIRLGVRRRRVRRCSVCRTGGCEPDPCGAEVPDARRRGPGVGAFDDPGRRRDATYAPDEFVANGQIVGMDVDLINAIGQVLGLKLKLENVAFATILTGMGAGKYEIGMSSFTDTKAA